MTRIKTVCWPTRLQTIVDTKRKWIATTLIVGLILLWVGQAAVGQESVTPREPEKTATENTATETTVRSVRQTTAEQVPALPAHLDIESGDQVLPQSAPASSDNIVASRRMLEIVRNGGPLMIPIGICSFILLIFVFERAIALRKSRVIPGPFSRRFIEQLKDGELDRDKAIVLCEKNASPVADIFKAGAFKWGRPGVEIEQAIMDAGERVSNELRKYLRLINGIATVCPLLGLLGTVLGMIHAFDAIATAGPASGDPKTLIATGISQALLTTAAGMSVAIPAIIAYLFFVGRVDKRIMELDALGQQFVNFVCAESQSTPKRRSSSRSNKAA